MSITLRPPAVAAAASRGRRPNGGAPARRAVARWGLRLFRREWRQQVVITALLALAVAVTVVGLAVATNATPSSTTTFVLPGTDRALDADIAAVQARFGPAVVYGSHKVAVPGSITTVDVRTPVPAAHATGASVRRGRLPDAAGEVAVTAGLASTFGLHVGDVWRDLGSALTVVGVVEDPSALGDEFAVLAPGAPGAADVVSVRVPHDLGGSQLSSFRLPSGSPREVIGESGTSKAAAAAGVLALGTLVLIFVGLVGVAGFSVMAHRRQRALGMLGSIGATDAHVRLVVLANGAAVGVVAALTGAVVGLAGWLAFAPHLEPSAGHRIDRFDLPWWGILAAIALAVVSAVASAWWPARAAARTSIVAALSARPPSPRPAGRAAALGVLALAAGITLLAFAGEHRALLVISGTVATVGGVLLLGPLAIRLASSLAPRLRVAPRLALRDLARYQARSGAALGAATLAVGIAAIVAVSSAAETTKDAARGGNLAANELAVYVSPSARRGGPQPTRTPDQLAAARNAVDAIAAGLGAGRALELDIAVDPSLPEVSDADGTLGRVPVSLGRVTPEPGGGASISLEVLLHVATPDLLSAYGITSVDPATDVLSSRPDLSGLQLELGGRHQLPPPRVQHAGLPRGTSEPNTLLTTAALERLGLQAVPDGWLVRAPSPLTAAQIDTARKAAAAAGLTIETRETHHSLVQLGHQATAAGILFALAVLAMTVGLIRSETANDLRILTATGATSRTRRALTASTSGVLALLAAVLGTAAAYAALVAFHRSHLDTLSHPPVADLVVILVGLPVVAVTAGWLLGGREPPAIARRPLD